MALVTRLQHVSVPMPPDGPDAARRFYGDALGLEEIPPPVDLSHSTLVWFRAGPNGQEIHCFADDGSGPRSANQHLCVEVDDLPAFRDHLAQAGVTVTETTPIRNRPRCFVRDPFGNQIELTQIVGEYQPQMMRQAGTEPAGRRTTGQA